MTHGFKNTPQNPCVMLRPLRSCTQHCTVYQFCLEYSFKCAKCLGREERATRHIFQSIGESGLALGPAVANKVYISGHPAFSEADITELTE